MSMNMNDTGTANQLGFVHTSQYQTSQEPTSKCPNCGYCPTCGRSNTPYYTPYNPYWPYNNYPKYVWNYDTNCQGSAADRAQYQSQLDSAAGYRS